MEEELRIVEESLKDLPEGKLICSQSGKYCKWYQSDGSKKVYLPKKEKFLAQKLAVKKYLTLKREDLMKEKRALETYLKRGRPGQGTAERLLTDFPGYQELLSPFFSPITQQLSEWADSPYEHNLKYPEQLIHKTGTGRLVRLKSEAMIDMCLYIHRIPFRYEAALELGETVVFPDFTIRHSETGKLYYWEHFGLMDDPQYCKNAFLKLQLYASFGILPSIQLITTFETKSEPLTQETIAKIVQEYFL